MGLVYLITVVAALNLPVNGAPADNLAVRSIEGQLHMKYNVEAPEIVRYPEDFKIIQEYLRRTGKRSIVYESSLDNMPVIIPNEDYYPMRIQKPDMSRYSMPILRPKLYMRRQPEPKQANNP